MTKEISWRAPQAVSGTMGSQTTAFPAPSVHELAVVGPVSGSSNLRFMMAFAEYGQKSNEAYTLTMDRDSLIAPGCGVWIAGTGETPDALVVAVRRYPLHVEADIKRVIA